MLVACPMLGVRVSVALMLDMYKPSYTHSPQELFLLGQLEPVAANQVVHRALFARNSGHEVRSWSRWLMKAVQSSRHGVLEAKGMKAWDPGFK